jgi:hypothetical protein
MKWFFLNACMVTYFTIFIKEPRTSIQKKSGEIFAEHTNLYCSEYHCCHVLTCTTHYTTTTVQQWDSSHRVLVEISLRPCSCKRCVRALVVVAVSRWLTWT